MKNNWKDKLKSHQYSQNGIICPSCNEKDFVCRGCIANLIQPLLAEQKKELMESLTNDLQHKTYCKVKGEQYKECALCYIERKLNHHD